MLMLFQLSVRAPSTSAVSPCSKYSRTRLSAIFCSSETSVRRGGGGQRWEMERIDTSRGEGAEWVAEVPACEVPEYQIVKYGHFRQYLVGGRGRSAGEKRCEIIHQFLVRVVRCWSPRWQYTRHWLAGTAYTAHGWTYDAIFQALTDPDCHPMGPAQSLATWKGGLVSPTALAANNHHYFHQQESKVPYKCAACPFFVWSFIGMFLFCGIFSSVVRLFALLVRLVRNETVMLCRDRWYILQSGLHNKPMWIICTEKDEWWTLH